MTLREKIKTLLRLRLSYIIPYASRWPEALALLAQPQNLPFSVKKLAILIDEIWYQAGDTTTDHNWYIKRGLLTGIYTSTELYLLTDASEKQSDTWGFLDRRIDDMVNLGHVQNNVEQLLCHIGNAITSFIVAGTTPAKETTQQFPTDNKNH